MGQKGEGRHSLSHPGGRMGGLGDDEIQDKYGAWQDLIDSVLRCLRTEKSSESIVQTIFNACTLLHGLR